MPLIVLWVVILVVPQSANAGFFSELVHLFYPSNESKPTDEGAGPAISMPILGSRPSAAPQMSFSGTGGIAPEPDPSVTSSMDSALVGSRNPLGTISVAANDEILIYTVIAGDTPSSIADRFSISLNTLLWSNNISNPNLVKVGDELVILPVSGVQYEVKKGDTVDTIAKKLKGDAAEIRIFNGLAIDETLKVGDILIIPDGELTPQSPSTGFSNIQIIPRGLPEYIGYYMRPILGGRKSRGIHGYNGVDLADSCGLPVFASAQGTAIIARSSGWNGGYGKYIVMSHPNGTQTLYAHLSNLIASVGQRVSQGSIIGAIGTTGNSTGCHAHFEVRGAKNPF